MEDKNPFGEIIGVVETFSGMEFVTLDSAQPVAEVRTMDGMMRETLARQ
jgi:hypothetical protein